MHGEIVIDQCRALHVHYPGTSLGRSCGIVIAYLNRVGLAARDPFDRPSVGQYRTSTARPPAPRV